MILAHFFPSAIAFLIPISAYFAGRGMPALTIVAALGMLFLAATHKTRITFPPPTDYVRTLPNSDLGIAHIFLEH